MRIIPKNCASGVAVTMVGDRGTALAAREARWTRCGRTSTTHCATCSRARVHHRRGGDARARHRRQQRDLQRRQRRAAEAAAVLRNRTGWSASITCPKGSEASMSGSELHRRPETQRSRSRTRPRFTRSRTSSSPAKASPCGSTSREVSASLFNVLRVRPALGPHVQRRREHAGQDQRRHPVATGSGSSASAATRRSSARTISSTASPMEVVGVMPAGFSYPAGARRGCRSSTTRTSSPKQRAAWYLTGRRPRLKPGVTPQQVGRRSRDARRAISRAQYPDANDGVGMTTFPLHERWSATSAGRCSSCWARSGFVLLIACANVANLLLARAAARESRDGGPRPRSAPDAAGWSASC